MFWANCFVGRLINYLIAFNGDGAFWGFYDLVRSELKIVLIGGGAKSRN